MPSATPRAGAPEEELDRRTLLAALTAFKRGDFRVRLPVHLTGLDGKIADTFNDLIDLNARLASELKRLGRVVGEEGRIAQRASLGNVRGGWAASIDSVNELIADLVHPTSETARVIGAAARGDLSQTRALEADGRPLRGEFLRTAKAVALEGHVAKLERLAEASIALHAAREVDALLEIVAESAAALIGARQVSVSLDVPPSAPLSFRGARVGRHRVERPHGTALAALERDVLTAETPDRVRMSRDELDLAHPREPGGLPLHGWLAAALSATNGRGMGWLQLSDKRDGEFGPEDEFLVVQLAHMASIAAENIFFDEAREANRLKDQFLATLSHELRTPLQTILSWACMLGEDGPEGGVERDPDTLTRGLAAIERSARAQTRLIEDLLDVSRIVTGKFALETQLLTIDGVLAAAVEDVGMSAQERGVELTLDAACPTAWVLGDPIRLRQVFGNLLSNAIKFTPKGGRVTLGAAHPPEGEAALEVRVSDTGKGIHPDFLPHLFEPFRQADSGSTRSHGGLGIGLAIVRHLVELHGGSVRAESEGVGRGAQFVLRFPIVKGPRATLEPARTVSREAREPSLTGVRVLVVDDEADARTSIEFTLKQYGAIVTAVDSAKEAMSTLEREQVDVLLSDLAMPGEDGLSLIRRVRAGPGVRLPAAALSAYGRAEDRMQAIQAGFDAHLSKPIEPVALAAAIEGLLERTRALVAASKPECR